MVVSGPEIRLRARSAETLALAVHELATNAVKYGALSIPDGRIAVTWRAEDRGSVPWLVLDWAEDGVPDPMPGRRGFGTELLEQTLPYELKAEVEQEFGLNGLRCRIAFPLTDHGVPSGAPAR